MERIHTHTIKKLLECSNQFYRDLLGYAPERTSLQQISENNWNEFANQTGLSPASLGVYLPRNRTAIIIEENPLSLFHEYFGHGLYCEQNLLGRKLVELEKRLLEEEKQAFSSKRFSLKRLQRFRKQNPTFQELEKFKEENLAKYELFAIWTEFLLTKEHSLSIYFEKKYSRLSKPEREAIDFLINFSQLYGDLATMYSQGMARRTNAERVRRLLKEVYKNKLQDVRFALLYGSRKEFSDIDVFVVSNNLPETDSWLDVRVYSQTDFERRLNLFDIAVTNPLMTGDFVLGDKAYFEGSRNRFLYQPINEKAIKHNLKESIKQRKLAANYPENSKPNLKGLTYSLTYLANALALREGKRLFEKEDLLLYSLRAPAEGDKPLQLKGEDLISFES